MKQQQTNKLQRTGALIALPFVLCWKLVKLVFVGIAAFEAGGHAQSQTEIEAQQVEKDEWYENEHQRQMDAFDRDEEEAFYDRMQRW